jgi:hypothetical protein
MWPTPKCMEVLFAVVASIISAMTLGTYSFWAGFFHVDSYPWLGLLLCLSGLLLSLAGFPSLS